MSRGSYVLAVDIGTTSTKVLAVRSADGGIAAQRSVEYPMDTPRPGYAEQDPELIFAAVIQAVGDLTKQAGLSPAEIEAVSFSAAMHSLIAVDREGRPITRCITWADQRSAGYAERLKSSDRGREIFRATGTPIHPMSPLPKLMWLTAQEPELVRQAAKFIGIKEYVFWRLFGRYVVDVSIASATGCLNLRRFEWHAPSLEAAGITADKLSEPVPCTFVLRGMAPELAARMGLGAETPFVTGASDGVLANLGAGAVEPGQFAVSIGTSGAIRGVSGQPLTDPEGRLFSYALDKDFWVIGGAINNGGIVMRWVRDQLMPEAAEAAVRDGIDPYDRLTAMASEVAPGAEGLLFLPLLTGERAPYWDAQARGVFYGLSLRHGQPHMVRAAMEGVMFQIQSVAAVLEGLIGEATEIRASGGFARSPLWRQMLSDITGRSVAIPESIESSGVGAAMVGLSAVRQIPVRELGSWAGSILHRHEPNPANRQIYTELAALYDEIYHRLAGSFATISRLQHA